MRTASLAEISTAFDAGFACGKDKLTSDGLPHLRPFNIGEGLMIELATVYRVPESEAPKGRTRLLDGDILFNNTNSIELVGKVAIVCEEMNAGYSNHITRIRIDRTKAEPRFVASYLNHLWRNRYFEGRAARWVSQAAINGEALKTVAVPLPPLDQQRRIAAVLERSARLVKLQREAAAKTRDVTPALFIEMFGDPARADIPRVALSEVADVASGLTKGRRLNGATTREVPYLRVANVQAGYLDLSEIKTIPATDREITSLRLEPGDVLLTEGGDHDKLGRGALWRGEIEECLHQNHVFRVRSDRARMDPMYFDSFLQTVEARHYFLRAAKRTTNLASINMTQLRALPIPLPDQRAQVQFRDKALTLGEMHKKAMRQASAAEELHRSLLAEVFGEA